MGLDWRWAPGASRALRRATNEDNFELPTYSAPERRAGAKNLPTYFWLPPVQSYVGRKKTKRWDGLRRFRSRGDEHAVSKLLEEREDGIGADHFNLVLILTRHTLARAGLANRLF